MFVLFPQLPIDIRRKIWLATLGPMMLTFTRKDPPPRKQPDHSESSQTPYLANLDRYVGNISAPDGRYKLFFVVEASATYLACKESRTFLRYVFAEPVKPDGGLPSWFDPAIDTVRFNQWQLFTLSHHPWFTQAQQLWIRIGWEAADFLNDTKEFIRPGDEYKDHRWLEENLASLKDITFEMTEVYGEGQWVHEWLPFFEIWYNHARWEPVSYSARVICYQDDTPEDEWLTPQNYLLVEKKVMTKRFQGYYGVSNWKEKIQRERTRCIVEASDEELENPGEFLKKHQHFGE
ncbi:hypothetical protein NQ176_g9942 [Zarea fungicola]|uniref:Uncharacterized protein n=1 Tax=Zarea fungicola TaxID=93591 RepID=A0ACC1MKR0_9HYPO|nr:hypothetical protein NQ176_g9942 [Lecanicillium fungicola]